MGVLVGEGKRARGAIFGAVLAVLLVFGATSGSPAPTDHLSPWIASDVQWEADLLRWLRLSYVEKGDQATYSMLASQLLNKPDLRTTYAAVNILAEFGYTPDNRREMGEWIDSLRREDGAYSAPGRDAAASPLQSTFMAVAILTRVGMPPQDIGQTAGYLLSLQGENGLFGSGASDTESIESRIGAARLAVMTLSNLGVDYRDALRLARERLQTYVEESLDNHVEVNLGHQPSQALVTAIYLLALTDATGIPQSAGDTVQSLLRQLSTLDTGVATVVMLNALLDAAETLSLPATGNEAVRSHLVDKVFPYQLNDGGFGVVTGMSDPVVTWEVVHLARRLQVPYPRSELLLGELADRQTRQGWIPFVKLNTSGKSKHIYLAVEIEKRLGVQQYDAGLVRSYLEQTILGGRAGLEELYPAFLAYRTLGLEDGDEILGALGERSVSAARSRGETVDDLPGYSYFVRTAKEAGVAIPEDLRDRIGKLAAQVKLQLAEQPPYLTIPLVYLIAVIQDGLEGAQVLSLREAEAVLMPLWAESGGFRTEPDADPDVHSTYLASRTLWQLGSDRIDVGRLIDFVLSCRDEYGFNYTSRTAAHTEDREYTPDFSSTYDALVLLEEAFQRLMKELAEPARALARDM